MPHPLAPSSEPSLLIALLLGLLQGLTEFLPISSSGHLVLAQALLGAPTPGIVMEVVLHAGTLMAVIVAYRRDLVDMARDSCRALQTGLGRRGQPLPPGAREVGLLLLATLPVVVAGLFLREPIETAFESSRIAAGMLLVTGLILLATRWARGTDATANPRIALSMGLMQVLSLLPGISRSGATISGGLFARGAPRAMARFSFLMSVPAILGSLVLQVPQLIGTWQAGHILPYLGGFLLAFGSGLAAIRILLHIMARRRFFLFGVYCLLAGLVGLWLTAP